MTILRFVILELVALTVLIGSLLGGVATRFGTGELAPLFHLVPIVAAIAMVIVPILFFGHPKSAQRASTPPPE
ncbi:MAG: hypothetical protein ACJ8M4_07060 [Chthoniobacterales bacterium]